MSAKRTDGNQASIVQLLRAAGCQVFPTHMVGRGFPDLVCAYQGTIFLVEVKDGNKAQSAQRLTPAEIEFHTEWDGAPVYIIANDDDALNMLDELRET